MTLYLHTLAVKHIGHKRAYVDVYVCHPEGFYSFHTYQMCTFIVPRKNV